MCIYRDIIYAVGYREISHFLVTCKINNITRKANWFNHQEAQLSLDARCQLNACSIGYAYTVPEV